MSPKHSPSIAIPSSPPTVFNYRKRTRPLSIAEFDDSTPSDPAFFSSDPPDPSVDNYFTPKTKKARSGTWWQQEQEQEQEQDDEIHERKAFERNVDSGIFMADDTGAGGVGHSKRLECSHGVPISMTLKQNETAVPRKIFVLEQANVAAARKRIAFFAENGEILESLLDYENERDTDLRKWFAERLQAQISHSLHLDLNNLGLQHLSDDLLAPLLHIIRQPRWQPGLRLHRSRSPRNTVNLNQDGNNCYGSSDGGLDYKDFRPNWKFSVSNNALTTLTPRIFELPGLESIDMSYNNITSLPPLIQKMQNLSYVSLKGNRLRYLPAEVIDLMRTTCTRKFNIITLKNPLFQPFSYVGFRALLSTIRYTNDSDEDYNPDNPDTTPFSIPLSMAVLRKHVAQLTDLRPACEAHKANPRLFEQQKRWLARLYQHFALTPELLWLAQKTRGMENSLPEEEKLEIIQKWNDRAARPLDKALMRAFELMEGSLLDDVMRKTFLIATTPVCYLDINGRPAKQSIALPSELPMDEIVLPARLVALKSIDGNLCCDQDLECVSQEKGLQMQSRVHSLYSLCLKTASEAPELPQVLRGLPEDTPAVLKLGLKEASVNRQVGGWICPTCKRNYVVPRAEWIEYHVLPHSCGMWETGSARAIEEMFLPFLRRVCSWGCIPHFDYE